MESVIMDLMYQIPSDEFVERCIITKDVVENGTDPIVIRSEKRSR